MEKLMLNANSIARIAGVQTLYSIIDQDFNDISDQDIDNIIKSYEYFYTKSDFHNRVLFSGLVSKDKDQYFTKKIRIKLFSDILKYTINNIARIDSEIKSKLLTYTVFEELSNIVVSILRSAISEISLQYPLTSIKIIISDFIAIADSFVCNKKEIGIINFILDKYINHEKKETISKEE